MSVFTAAFTGRRQLTQAIRTGHDLPALGVDPDLLLDDLEDYVLWSVIAHHRRYPAGADTIDGLACRDVAEQMVRHWHPAVHRMVAETDPATVRYLRFKQSTLIEPWTPTPVTVIGDAVHNMPPVGGLGANTALRDAAELSSRLTAVRDRTDLLTAIGGYETQMRDYGYGAVRAAAHNTQRAISSNQLTRHGARAWLRLCRALPVLKRRSFGHVWKDTRDPRPPPIHPDHRRDTGAR